MTRTLIPLLLAAAWTALTVTGASAGIVWGASPKALHMSRTAASRKGRGAAVSGSA